MDPLLVQTGCHMVKGVTSHLKKKKFYLLKKTHFPLIFQTGDPNPLKNPWHHPSVPREVACLILGGSLTSLMQLSNLESEQNLFSKTLYWTLNSSKKASPQCYFTNHTTCLERITLIEIQMFSSNKKILKSKWTQTPHAHKVFFFT